MLKRVFKNAFVLCLLVVGFMGLDNVKAISGLYDISVLIPQKISFNQNGNTKFNIDLYGGAIIPGDVNGDLVTNYEDVISIYEYARREPGAGEPENVETFKIKADVDKNGVVEIADAYIVLRNILGIYDDYQANFGSVLSDMLTSENSYMKYALINGDSEFYTRIKEYVESVDKLEITSLNEVNETREILESLRSDMTNRNVFINSNDISSIEGNIGKTKVDKIYLVIASSVNLTATTSTIAACEDFVIKEIDVSNFDWDAYFDNIEKEKLWNDFVEEYKQSEVIKFYEENDIEINITSVANTLKVELDNYVMVFNYENGILTYNSVSISNDSDAINNIILTSNILYALSNLKGYNQENVSCYLQSKEKFSLEADGLEFEIKEKVFYENNSKGTYDVIDNLKLDLENGFKTYNDDVDYSKLLKEDDKDSIIDFNKDNLKQEIENQLEEETVENPKTGTCIGIGSLGLILISILIIKQKNKFNKV